MKYKQQLRPRYEKEAVKAEERVIAYYAIHPGETPDGSFVMNVALRYHDAMERARKRREAGKDA